MAAVELDFKKTRASLLERKTIAYRYVLLRAHENFDRALPQLLERYPFSQGLANSAEIRKRVAAEILNDPNF